MHVKFMKAKLSEDQFRQVGMDIAELIVKSGITKSKSEARRAIEQKSIKFNDIPVSDMFARAVLDTDTLIILEHDD